MNITSHNTKYKIKFVKFFAIKNSTALPQKNADNKAGTYDNKTNKIYKTTLNLSSFK